MSKTKLIDAALPYQRRFITAPARRKIWLSTRQAGKSWSLSFIAVQKALERDGGLSLCISTGARAANELVKKCEKMAYAVQALSRGRLQYVASADGVRFANGSRVISLPSGNPAGLRGYTAQCVLIDEAAYIDNPYDVYAAIVPTLTRDKEAELIVASTPAGKHGLFWDLWNKDEGWYRQSTTIEEAVKEGLDVDVEELRKTVIDPEVWDMEYMCRFADSFSEFLDLNSLQWYEELPASAVWYLGMDVGSTSDRTALASIADVNGVLHLEDLTVLHKASYERQLQVMKDLNKKYRYTAGYVDQNGIGSALAEFATKQVSPRVTGFTWTSANKTPAYEALRAAVYDRRLLINRKFKSAVELDFQNVHRIVNESGRVFFEAGRNGQGHSDITSAIVLGLQAAKDKPASFASPQSWAFPSAFGARSSRL